MWLPSFMVVEASHLLVLLPLLRLLQHSSQSLPSAETARSAALRRWLSGSCFNSLATTHCSKMFVATSVPTVGIIRPGQSDGPYYHQPALRHLLHSLILDHGSCLQDILVARNEELGLYAWIINKAKSTHFQKNVLD